MKAVCREFHAKTDLMSNEFQGIHARTEKKEIPINRSAGDQCGAWFAAEAIHSDKSQAARMRILDIFKKNRVRVLVATDIAARGLDVDRISHVVNYDLPDEPETYVHRIGRTARAGKGGDAVSFCSAKECGALRSSERLLGKQLPVREDAPFHSDTACETCRESQSAEKRKPFSKRARQRDEKRLSKKTPYSEVRRTHRSKKYRKR